MVRLFWSFDLARHSETLLETCIACMCIEYISVSERHGLWRRM